MSTKTRFEEEAKGNSEKACRGSKNWTFIVSYFSKNNNNSLKSKSSVIFVGNHCHGVLPTTPIFYCRHSEKDSSLYQALLQWFHKTLNFRKWEGANEQIKSTGTS